MSEPNDPYASLVGILRAGGRIDMGVVDDVLAKSRRSARDLLRILVTRPRSASPGDRCQSCGGKLHVYHTHTTGGRKTQYLRCRQCGIRPKSNKRVILLQP